MRPDRAVVAAAKSSGSNRVKTVAIGFRPVNGLFNA
jgi:hypothetical protein